MFILRCGMEDKDALIVTVKNIVFQANTGAFCVFRGENPEVGTIAIVYKGQAPYAGEQVKLHGKWVQHPRFGQQFQADSWEAQKPSGREGLVRMLGSGVLKGIGPSLAERIVNAFGDKTLEILEKYPERLREVSGIGKKKAEAIVASYGELKDTRDLVFFLEASGRRIGWPRLWAWIRSARNGSGRASAIRCCREPIRATPACRIRGWWI